MAPRARVGGRIGNGGLCTGTLASTTVKHSYTGSQASQQSESWLKHAYPGLICLIASYLFSATHASEMSAVEQHASWIDQINLTHDAPRILRISVCRLN